VTSANVDLVRSICRNWEHGDWSSAEWAHPEIEWERADGSEHRRWRGLAGMAEGWRDWLNAWEDFRIAAVDEYRELDDERVLVLHRFSGRGKTSGLEVEQTRTKGASLFHVRDGKVTRLISYAIREEALADLGLPPETGSPPS
jgi:ketosteroid isomerase-like protein